MQYQAAIGRSVRLVRQVPGNFTIDQQHPDLEAGVVVEPRGQTLTQELGAALFAELGLPVTAIRPSISAVGLSGCGRVLPIDHRKATCVNTRSDCRRQSLTPTANVCRQWHSMADDGFAASVRIRMKDRIGEDVQTRLLTTAQSCACRHDVGARGSRGLHHPADEGATIAVTHGHRGPFRRYRS